MYCCAQRLAIFSTKHCDPCFQGAKKPDPKATKKLGTKPKKVLSGGGGKAKKKVFAWLILSLQYFP